MYKGQVYICLKRGETVFLEVGLANGTCILTSHRLIIVEHEKDGLGEGTHVDYPMKDFLKASLNNETIVAHFADRKQAKLRPAQNTLVEIQEIKQYIEQIATIWNSKD